MTGLSIEALRRDDELDILKPLHIDPRSGYRYCGVDPFSSAHDPEPAR
jgi:hypothetical protein